MPHLASFFAFSGSSRIAQLSMVSVPSAFFTMSGL